MQRADDLFIKCSHLDLITGMWVVHLRISKYDDGTVHLDVFTLRKNDLYLQENITLNETDETMCDIQIRSRS